MLITHSDNITDLFKALLAVQAQLRPAVQDSNNPFCGSKYASLNSVMESCRSALAQNGIVLPQAPVPSEPGFTALETILVHAETGQFVASVATAPLPKADPQGVGTALTYLRRYALSAMLGIVTEPDTDGEFDVSPKQAKSFMPSRPKPTAPFDASRQKQSAPLSPAFAALPDLPGITYREVMDETGERLVLASGETMQNRGSLKKAGFQWNPSDRRWWRAAV